MSSTAGSHADGLPDEDEALGSEATRRQRSKPSPDVLLAFGIGLIYVLAVFFLTNGPARNTQIVSHGDIPTDTLVLRSAERSIAAPTFGAFLLGFLGERACGDTECAALIPSVPGEYNKGIYITVVRQFLISRPASLSGGTLKIDVGVAPDRVVLVNAIKTKHVESDDNRRWTYLKSVFGFRLWVGSIQ